jgi:hypothetical protein
MVAITEDVIDERGRWLTVKGTQIDDKRLVIRGRLLMVARIKDEWWQDVGDPERILEGLRRCKPTPDLFTFWQRLPDTLPRYPYYNEAEALSAIALKDFDYWWKHQIKSDTRKKTKRAENRGIEIRIVSLDDDLVTGVMGIFNESPMRRGKPFWHYGKNFHSVKEILLRDVATSKFIAAYSERELVGIVKLNYASQRFANPGLFLSKLKFRDKYLDNALLAKCVEQCCKDGVSYLTYTSWRRGSHAEFLQRHGFEKTCVPRYWIPLTKKGSSAIKLGFHREMRTRIPEGLLNALLRLRERFYISKFGISRDTD